MLFRTPDGSKMSGLRHHASESDDEDEEGSGGPFATLECGREWWGTRLSELHAVGVVCATPSVSTSSSFTFSLGWVRERRAHSVPRPLRYHWRCKTFVTSCSVPSPPHNTNAFTDGSCRRVTHARSDEDAAVSVEKYGTEDEEALLVVVVVVDNGV